MPGQREDAEALGLLRAQRREGAGAAGDDVGHARDRLDVVHHRRARVQAGDRGERRLQPRLAAVAFQGVEQRGLLTALVGTGARVYDDVEPEPRAQDVRAQVPGLVCLGHRLVQAPDHVQDLAAHVDEREVRPDRVRRDDRAFDERVRRRQHRRDVLAGARLGFVGVDDQVMRLAAALRDETPLHARREAGAAATAQARCLHRGDDLVGRHRQRLGQRLVAARPAVPAQGEGIRLVPVGGELGGQYRCHVRSLLPLALAAPPSWLQPFSLAIRSPASVGAPAVCPVPAWSSG